ncbi:MAG: hypothetical protein RLZZ535_2188, partial [Cyanobacteriota bacterium]
MKTLQSDRTILIVNDSLLERTTFRCYLQQETNFAYTVWEAESTEQAWQLCDNQLPDGIVLDYLLPDRDGLMFLVELKTSIGENCPPVIMLNDQGNEAIAIQAFKAGVEDYLIKQEITSESLRYVTRTAIKNFRLRQKLHKSEVLLRQSEERYRGIIDQQTELICRFSPDLTLTFVNQAYSRYFGSTAEQLIGQNFLNLIPESDRSSVQQQITNLSMATPENAVLSHEHPVLKPNGEIGVQQWMNRAIFAQNGQLIEFQAVGRDISDRVLTESALRQSEAFNRQILETIPDCIKVLDLEGKILYLNSFGQDLLDLRDQSYLNVKMVELWQVGDRQQLEQAINIALSGEISKFEGYCPLKNGTPKWWEVIITPRFDANGQVERLLSVSRDISDRQQAEQELAQLLTEAQTARALAEAANRSKDEFVTVIAHELRSPINSVAGWAQLLRMRKFDPANIDRALEAIERGTQTQVQLIEDLLDISRIASGKLRLTLAPVNLAIIVGGAINLMRPMAEAKQIHLDSRLTASAQVSGDLNRLQQIVVNLLTNAIKFTPEQGRVTISLEQVAKQVQIQVRDTGKGINPEFLPNIFERFQQGQKNSGSKDGLGLGL